MKYIQKIILLIVMIIFYGCIPNEGIPHDINDMCIFEYDAYSIRLKKCNIKKRINRTECNMDSYEYSSKEFKESEICKETIATTSCEDMKNITDISDFPGCPTFRDK